jgi:hypothetical protein
MMKKKDTIKPEELEWEPEDTERLDGILILKKEPLSRKTKLIEAGVKEVRCVWCLRIKPIATAEEIGDGWLCEGCLSDLETTRRCGGQRGK